MEPDSKEMVKRAKQAFQQALRVPMLKYKCPIGDIQLQTKLQDAHTWKQLTTEGS